MSRSVKAGPAAAGAAADTGVPGPSPPKRWACAAWGSSRVPISQANPAKSGVRARVRVRVLVLVLVRRLTWQWCGLCMLGLE
jgi:hypothetical protein